MHEPGSEIGPDVSIGVAIVLYRSDDVIEACLESLVGSRYPDLRVVLVDNDSPDASVERVRAWARVNGKSYAELQVTESAVASMAPVDILVLRSPINLGYAGGVNVALRTLLTDPQRALFWVLNPDCTVAPGTPAAYASAAAATPRFALMSGRTLFHEPPDVVQSDGGTVNRWTGACSNIHRGMSVSMADQAPRETPDYFVGANVVASRQFLEQVGFMPEGYFLFYEEVEWALGRGDLPLVSVPAALVWHRTGTAIGSGSLARAANGFANYFNFRNRLLFIGRINPFAIPVALGYSLIKILQIVLKGDWQGALGALFGLLQLPPPRSVRQRVSPNARQLAFRRGPRIRQ